MDRDSYIEQLKAELDRWNADSELLQAKVELARSGLSALYDRQLEALREIRLRAEQRLSEMRSTSRTAWPQIARGAEHAWQELRADFERAREDFERRGSPLL